MYSILYIRSFIYLLFISFSKQLNFVWGEKQNTHIPPPVGHMIDWRRAEVRDPIHSRTQMPSEFTSLRNDQCQKHFIIPFTHRVGRAGRKFYFSLKIPALMDSRHARMPRMSFYRLFCRSSLHTGLRDWIGNVQFFSLINNIKKVQHIMIHLWFLK